MLASVLEYLAMAQRQRRVVWYARTNTGAGRLLRRDGTLGQFLRFGFPGCPDILGQLPDGRLLAIEVKRPSGRVRPEQQAFLDRATLGGAVAQVVRSVDDVHRLLGQ